MTSVCALIARAKARRLDPCVDRSSSPQHTSVEQCSLNSTMGRNLSNATTAAQGPTADFLDSLRMATIEDVTDVLRDVIDPELGLDFVELGLIYDVEIQGPSVRVTYTLTSPGCPIGPQVAEQIEEFVSELEGVDEVHPTMTFSPPWTPDRMSEDAKFALGF